MLARTIVLLTVACIASRAETLSGAVKEQTGAAVSSTFVILEKAEAPNAKRVVSTSEDGVFQFEDVAAGRYRLEFVANGFEALRTGVFSLNESGHTASKSYTLRVGEGICGILPLIITGVQAISGAEKGSLAGRLMDGRVPIPNVQLSLVGSRRVSTTTDKEGWFELQLPPGVYQLMAEPRGFYSFESHAVHVRAGLRLALEALLSRCPAEGCSAKHPPVGFVCM